MYRLKLRGIRFSGKKCRGLEQVSVCVRPVSVWLMKHRQHTEEFVIENDSER